MNAEVQSFSLHASSYSLTIVESATSYAIYQGSGQVHKVAAH